MSAYLLHSGATVNCAHQPGRAEAPSPSPRVKVAGQQAVTLPAPWTVSGCTLPNPPAANGPCATAQWTTAATRVKVGGMAVLLSDSQATCVPSGTPLQVATTQTRVKGG
jgi:hypothetical protein